MSNFASGYIKYINHLEQINEGALSCPERMIAEVEDSYHEHIRNVARNLKEHHPEVRIVMLSGPSSSGKTTTAHLLQRYLAGFGTQAHIVSLDNFYRGRGIAPVLPTGRFDYESVEALNAEQIRACLRAAAAGEPFSVPRYSFDLGRADGEDRVDLQRGDMVIVEGIHGLNPTFTRELPEEACVKIYVSVKQQIKDANGEVISPMDLRLVRRIVRDVQFRSTPAAMTMSMWYEVVAGEDKYIRPYRLSADYTVNSVHIYEPCVFRTAAIPLLREIAPDDPNYRKARDLESRLMRFEPMDSTLVPESSMLREFLG